MPIFEKGRSKAVVVRKVIKDLYEFDEAVTAELNIIKRKTDEISEERPPISLFTHRRILYTFSLYLFINIIYFYDDSLVSYGFQLSSWQHPSHGGR